MTELYNYWTHEEIDQRIIDTLKMPVDHAMAMRECLEQVRALLSNLEMRDEYDSEIIAIQDKELAQLREQNAALVDGLQVIRDGRYSAEGARDIAAKTLLGAPDYRLPATESAENTND